MSDPYLAAFLDRVRKMDDDALLKTLTSAAAAPQAYKPEAIKAVQEEVTRRGITHDRMRETAQRWREDAMHAIQTDARELADRGYSSSEIATRLRRAGAPMPAADAIATAATDMPTDERRAAGRRNMLVGAGLMAVGLLITLSGYVVAASSPSGGRVAVWWGLVLVGALQFIRGLNQVSRT